MFIPLTELELPTYKTEKQLYINTEHVMRASYPYQSGASIAEQKCYLLHSVPSEVVSCLDEIKNENDIVGGIAIVLIIVAVFIFAKLF